jgi:aquaporin Z
VTIGLIAGGRFKASDAAGYIVAQVAGAIAAAGVLKAIALNPGSLAANGFGEHSPSAGLLGPGYGMGAAFGAEYLLTFFFLVIILGATHRKAPAGFAPIPIGLGLTLIHLIGIPVTNLSVNPARSTGPAIFAEGGWALGQLWLFWVAPIAGAVTAGVVAKFLEGDEPPAAA